MNPLLTYPRSAVNSFTKSAESNMSIRMTALHALDDRIANTWCSLPVHLQLTPSSISLVPHDILPNLLLVHTAYHQCICALHSSIVPLFSWSPSDNTWLKARQLSAQTAFEHACNASELFEAVLLNFHRLSAIPSFVAYAAYCGCAIQIPFMWCSQPTVRERANANVKTNIRMIHTLAPYWRFSELLVRPFFRIHFTQKPNFITRVGDARPLSVSNAYEKLPSTRK